VSIDFDPVPLRPRRRRVDPMVVGLVVAAFALGAAVLKPWETRQAVVAPAPSALLAAASASVPPTPRASQRRAPTAGPLQPAWAEIAPEVTPHDLLGVRTIVAEPGATGRPEGTTFGEGWVPAAEVGGVDTVRVANEDRAIVAMGPTFPTDAGAADARIWRVHAGGVLEWVDARPIEPEDPAGSFLFVRTGRGGAPYTWWPAGTYRIDVLGAGGIHRIDVDIPGRFGLVPAPDAMVIPVVGVVPAAGSDLSSIRSGLFATADGFGVALAATQTRPLDAAGAWNDLAGFGAGAVATAFLPTASGLGVMLAPNSDVEDASMVRLSPDGVAAAPSVLGTGVVDRDARSPDVLFVAPDWGPWPAGVYAITVRWRDGTGTHIGTWHAELRPGLD
jgi:hypothetical protein